MLALRASSDNPKGSRELPRYVLPVPPKGTRHPGSGRVKGTPNKVSVEARVLVDQIINDPVYQRRLAADIRDRKVHPTIESMVWAYHLGRPRQQVDITTTLDATVTLVEERRVLATLDLSQLEAMAAETQRQIDLASALRQQRIEALSPPDNEGAERKSEELLGNRRGSDNTRSVNEDCSGQDAEETPDAPTG